MRRWLFSSLMGAIAIGGCTCNNQLVQPGTDAAGPVVTADAGAPDASGCGLRTCPGANATCGPIGDGCGDIIHCGTCDPPQTCGGGGTVSQCGGTSGCTPQSCADQNADCGPVGDGCGDLLQCGSCPTPQECGAGGRSKCGIRVSTDGGGPIQCTPRTCQQAHADCGPVGDGCGGLLQCGTCVAPLACGGGGTPSVCGAAVTTDAGVQCTNLCLQQVACSGGGSTTVTGTVYAPNGQQPLPNVVIYVPNGTVEPFTPGVACEKCGAAVSGEPLVSATSAPDGTFTLLNVPVGANIPLVIQLGRWRRQFSIPSVAQCTNTALDAGMLRMPRNKNEGDIPLMAMVTGDVDTLECVLRKIGIDDAEFTNPSGNGRIRVIHQNGVVIDSNTPEANDVLWGSSPTLDDYDVVLFACEGGQHDKPSTAQQRVIDYANRGGRVFATHYSYVWLYNAEPWGCGDECTTAGQTAAEWHINQDHPGDSVIGILDTSFPRGQIFSQWLDVVGASTAPGSGRIEINDWRRNLDAVFAPTQRWVYTTSPEVSVQHLTFNTPVGTPAEEQCGRVLFSDFHVADSSGTNGTSFPDECGSGAMTAQEKVLEFMIFDLTSCIAPDKPVSYNCTAQTCQDQGFNCGPAGDGCGLEIDCGDCTPPATCGGGGVPGVCGNGGPCVVSTCEQFGVHCGPAGDGCGGLLQCGECPPPQTCGGGGVPGVCGNGPCTPNTCATFAADCGQVGDGCGGVLDCGECPPPYICGGNGIPNICGVAG